MPSVFKRRLQKCRNGHALCATCKNKMQSNCPTCRCKLDDIRSLPFEKLLAALGFTCKYYKFGCFESFPYNAKPQHETKCKFRPYGCPYPLSTCMASGDITKITNHMKIFHKCKIVDHPIEYEVTYTKQRGQEDVTYDLIICTHLGESFCLYVRSISEHGNVSFFMYMMLMGDNSQVDNFSYRVQVCKDSRKTLHEGIPCSIRDGYEKVEAREDGLVINSKAAQLFSTDSSQKLSLWVTSKIWKE